MSFFHAFCYMPPTPIQQSDLPIRLMYDLPLANPDRATFYLPGDLTTKGYTDFPVADAHIEES